MIRSHKDLIAWQKAMDVVIGVYGITATLPASETFGLVSQMRRAAVSIASSLAEGHARSSTKEFSRYISIALGSNAELETQLLILARLKMIPGGKLTPRLEQCNELGRVLRGLKKSVDRNIAARSKVSP